MPDSPDKQAGQKTLPYLWWNFFTLSALLVLVFGYILPHRFLEKAAADENAHTEGGGTMTMQMDDGHAMTDEHMQEHTGEMMEDGHMMTEEHMESGMMTGGMMMNENDGHAHGGTSNYHEAAEVIQGPVVTLQQSLFSYNPKVGQRLELEFSVQEALKGTPITNLEIEHEKYMHVIGVRDDLNEFFHIHPQRMPGKSGALDLWISSYTFAKPGTYKLWTGIKVDGKIHTFGQPLLTVEGEGATSEKNVSFETEKPVDDYLVRFQHDQSISAGSETEVHFSVGDKNRNIVEVEPYLGADMHLVAIKEDLSAYVHTHPAEPEGSGHSHSLLSVPVVHAHGAEGVAFNATFPSAGTYKLFAQFRPRGTDMPADEALTASFYVEVTAEAAKVISSASASAEWWYKFVYSIIGIAILGWAIKKFITVPAAPVKK